MRILSNYEHDTKLNINLYSWNNYKWWGKNRGGPTISVIGELADIVYFQSLNLGNVKIKFDITLLYQKYPTYPN